MIFPNIDTQKMLLKLSLALYDYVYEWSCLFMHGHWSCVVMYSQIRKFMVMYGPAWSCMIIYMYGHAWSCTDKYNVSMVMHGGIWSCMVMVMYCHV